MATTTQVRGDSMATTTQVVRIIRREVIACVEMARSMGYGEGPYTLTEEDCAYVKKAVRRETGRLPTRAEWSTAGFDVF